MKISQPTAALLLATCAFVSLSASAQDVLDPLHVFQVSRKASQDESETAGSPATFLMPTLTAQPGWQLESELLFIRFHKESGTQVGLAGVNGGNSRGMEAYETKFELAPRISIAHVRPNNVFYKVRWFDYKHNTRVLTEGPDVTGAFSNATIDAFSIDFVAGERFYLARGWDIEVDGGIRYFGYEEHRLDVDSGVFDDEGANDFEMKRDISWGLGAIVGFEARKQLTANVSMFGRLRTAVVQGGHTIGRLIEDRLAPGSIGIYQHLSNVTSMQFELATGTEWNWILGNGDEVFFRLTGEAISWSDVSTGDVPFPTIAGDIDLQVGGVADAGWGGFGLVFGIYR